VSIQFLYLYIAAEYVENDDDVMVFHCFWIKMNDQSMSMQRRLTYEYELHIAKGTSSKAINLLSLSSLLISGSVFFFIATNKVLNLFFHRFTQLSQGKCVWSTFLRSKQYCCCCCSFWKRILCHIIFLERVSSFCCLLITQVRVHFPRRV